MSTTDWDATLDAFETRLTEQWESFHEGSLEPVAPFEPPAVTASLPQRLVTRATELVWRCRALEEALTTALAAATEQLERLDETGSSPASPAEPVFFDSRV